MYCMRKLRSFGVNSDMLVTFYNAVICSIIMFGSVCWGGNISKLDRGRMEKIVKKAGHVVGKPLDSFKTLHEKRLYRKLMQILNNPTHPMRHYFDSRHSNRSGRFLLPRTNTNHYKASFLPWALSFFYENLYQSLTECVHASICLFLTEGWGCVNLMIFIWSFYVLVWHRESIIPGNFGFAITKY